MDVTPRELRDIDIRERFGLYNRDDVDDLLERAASRIEALDGQLRAMQAQVDSGAADANKTRETEDMLHRTLLLAQRAADEAVAEAQSKARQILDDAETKSRTMVSEAETNARRQAETERRRLEGEVLELGAKRDALVADIDALEQFEADYRVRLRRAVEADLEMLSSKGSVAPSPRPTTHDVVMPSRAAAEAVVDAPGTSPAPAAVATPPAPSPSPAPVAPSPPPAAVPPPAFGVAASSSPSAPAPAKNEPAEASETATPWEESSTPPVTRPPLFDSEPDPGPDPEHLDDDAFFASLREAVTDETPLGPRDTAGTGEFDPDDQRGGLFRRRGR